MLDMERMPPNKITGTCVNLEVEICQTGSRSLTLGVIFMDEVFEALVFQKTSNLAHKNVGRNFNSLLCSQDFRPDFT